MLFIWCIGVLIEVLCCVLSYVFMNGGFCCEIVKYFSECNSSPFACCINLRMHYQFSPRKLLEGDWGSSITVCVKCEDTETHISSCLKEYFVVLNSSTKR